MQRLADNQRLDWLDVLKCIAMFAVVVGHAASGETPDTLKYYIYSFHMPLFFIISGMSFYLQTSRREYSFSEMFINKCRTLLWPYFIFNLLFLPLWFCYFKFFDPNAGSIPDLLLAILYSNHAWSSLPISASWFLTVLFLATILFFAVIKACKGNDRLLVLICVFLGLGGYAISLFDSINLLYPWHLSTVLIACMLLMMGYFFMEHIDCFDGIIFRGKEKSASRALIVIAWIAACFAVGMVCARFNVKVSMSLHHYGNFILFIGAVIAFSLMFYILSRIIPPYGILKFIGRNTIVYLCTHELGIIAMTVLSPATNSFVMHYPVLAALVIFIALIPVAYVIEKWLPFLKRI